MDRLTVVRSLTHPYPLHGTVYATTGIPEVDTKIEAPAAAQAAVAVHRVAGRLLRGAAAPAGRRGIAAQRRAAVRDGLQERDSAAGRPVRRDARHAVRPGLYRISRPKGRSWPRRSGPARRSKIRSWGSVPPTACSSPAATGSPARWSVLTTAPLAARTIQSGSPRPGQRLERIGTFSQQQQLAFSLLTSGKMQRSSRLWPGADADARSVRHDAVRPVVPRRPAAGRGGEQVRHRHSGTPTASTPARGTRTTTTTAD